MTKRLLKCVECAQKNENRLNQDGKLSLALNIIELLTAEELDEFLKEWGYDRENE